LLRVGAYYLRPNVRAEPLLHRWPLWDQLVPPPSAAMNIVDSHIPIMESYVASPEAHSVALRDPALVGGPYVDYDRVRVDEIADLLSATEAKQAALIELSQAIHSLDGLLRKQAKGSSLELLYRQVPSILRGYVELVYDINSHPSVRFIEGLLYRSRFFDRSLHAFALSLVHSDRRPFQWSTPVLDDPEKAIVALPFDDHRIDTLFASDRNGADEAELRVLIGSTGNDTGLFEALFSATPARASVRYAGEGVRVRYFGHACVLVETAGVSILTDPFVSYDYPADVSRYTLADLPDQIDYALITHAHSDHLELQTLLRLRSRIKHVVIPRSAGRRREDPSLRLMLANLGFTAVLELHELEAIAIPGGEIIAMPFLGEHSDLDIQTKSGYLVRANHRSLLFAADSCNLEPEVYRSVHGLLGDVDILFLGMECEGSPLTWGYGALLTQRIDHQHAQSRRDAGSNCEQALALVDALRAHQVFVYAMGQEPWLNHVLGITPNHVTRGLLESDALIRRLLDRNARAERLFGRHELTMPPGT
jgi:L-ascorbate metabolism protein UlaG (beta-lactamase superfamily)